MKNFSYFWRHGLWTLFSLAFIGLVFSALAYLYLVNRLPDVESLKTVQLEVPLQIFTEDGRLMQEYGETKRIPIAYEDIPKPLIQALLVTEDQRFFEHPGVDFLGLGRAALSMIQTGSKSQGGSTITMQVARNFFLDRKKTFLRKFNEILLAIKIDQELSKEKILELYFNKIYLGHRAYGVEAAAQVYYGKSLKELNLSQLAMIAGLPQAPSTQNPIVNPTAALHRRNHVLDRMLEEQVISQAEHDKAIKEPIQTYVHGTLIETNAPYVAEMIRQALYDQFGQDIYTKGYRVYSTINSTLQDAANASIETELLAYDRRHGYRGAVAQKASLDHYPVIHDLIPAYITEVSSKSAKGYLKGGQPFSIGWSGLSFWLRRAHDAHHILHAGDIVYVQNQKDEWILSQVPEVEGALVALDPHNGAIKALVGGFNFPQSKFNRAVQSGRQPGSSFKPFIYTAALNKGYSLASTINDAPIVVSGPGQANIWRPHNVDHTFAGPTRLKEALIRSRNMVSIRILDDIGIDYAIDFVTRFGFPKDTLPKGLSLALGTLSVSPLQMAVAYAIFANGGYKIEPFLIDRMVDLHQQTILQSDPKHIPSSIDHQIQQSTQLAPRVLSSDIAFLMHTALQDVIQKGTAQQAKQLQRQDIAGKTGTTNEQMDGWFCGYTPDLVVATWVGFDTPRSLHEYGAQIALPIWIRFMQTALSGKPEHLIQPPINVITEYIDAKTGLRALNPEQAIIEYFRDSELPSETPLPSETSTSEDPDNLF